MNRSRHEFWPGAKESLAAEPIAIVGAACRLPGAADLEAFRRLLLNGVDAVTEIPDERWNKSRLYHPERGYAGKSYTFAAGVLDDVKSFDAAFFGMSPREAEQTDPQQRLALELAYEAMEDAGLDASKLAGERVGVFVGGSAWDYTTLHSSDPASMDAYSMTGATLCSIANRISYMFDLRGPSFTVDTACSSSIVALHQACEAIRSGSVPAAIVGGVSLLLTPQSFVGFSAASMLSPRGRCHAFDHRADGYVRAEGGGFIILKPLGEALAAGDPIRAVIRGTGVNSDGRTTGFSLPNKQAQIALLEEVYSRFGLDPDDLVYLEAHGTGTPAGDPIEAGALGAVLGRRRGAPLPIGSVKTNIGHLEAASGMAGLMKAIVVAENYVIPPSLNLEQPNPNIPFADLNLQLVPSIQAIEVRAGALIGINSFGFGGTNAHAVLERHGLPSIGFENNAAPLPPLLLSAQTTEALNSLAAEWIARVDAISAEHPTELPRLVRSAALNRSQHKRRLVVQAEDAEGLAQALADHIQGNAGIAQSDTAVSGKIAFIFSGNGSQWAGMAQDALALSPAFREALAEVDTVLAPELGWSVAEALAAQDAVKLRETAVAQPLLFAVQVALVMALRASGVEADACMGHSVGEVAAAWAAGALDLHQAARVIAARSGAQQTLHGQGGMAVLGLDAAASSEAVAEIEGLAVAAHNSSGGTTVAGSLEGLERLEMEAKSRGWRFTRLDLDYAFHSPIMNPIKPQIAESLRCLKGQASEDRFISTVTGAKLDGSALDADYWWRNVRQPVLFAEATADLVAQGYRIFLEIGPHPVLRAYLSEALRAADAEGRVLPTLQRRPAAYDPIKLIAARAHAAGADIRGSADFFGPVSPRGLPRYPWARETFWLGRTAEAADRYLLDADHPLLGIRQSGEAEEWRQHLGLGTHPWIADHQVGGTAVVPAAALLDMGLAAARARYPNAAAVELLEVEIGRALVLEPGVLRETMLRIDTTGEFEIRSRPRLAEDSWTVHVKGRIAALDSVAPGPAPEPAVVTGHLSHAALYMLAAEMGLEYGPAFRAVTGVDLLEGDDAVAQLEPTELVGTGFLLSPDLLDGALQGLLGLAAQRLGSGSGVMPWRFGRVRLLDGGVPATAHMRLTRIGPRSVRADVELRDGEGKLVALLGECWFVRVALAGQLSIADMLFHPAERLAMPLLPVSATAIDPAALLPAADDEASEAALLADAAAAAIAFDVLTIFAGEARVIEPFALVREGRLSKASLPLLQDLLDWLVQDGLATEEGGTWTLHERDLPPVAAILQTLLAETPSAVAEVALLAAAREALADRLATGEMPSVSPALLDQMRYHSPAGRAASTALIVAVRKVATAWPADRPLRVLEIHARRGGLTQWLLRALDGTDFALTALTEPDDLPTLAALLADAPAAHASSGTVDSKFDLIVSFDAAAVAQAMPLGALAAEGAILLLADPLPGRLQVLIGNGAALPNSALFSPSLVDRRLHDGLWATRLLAARLSLAQSAPASVPEQGFRAVAAASDQLAVATAGLLGIATPEAELGALEGPTMIFLDELGPTLADRLAIVASLAAAAPQEGSVEVVLVVTAHVHDPAGAAIRGARRVLANEAPTISSRLIRIDPALERPAEALAAELLNGDGEQEVSLLPDRRLVSRIHRGLPAHGAEGKALRLAVARPGMLDSLNWNPIDPGQPGPGELAIKIEAAGVNFRDVMWAMGLLPDEALLDGFAGPTLGLECAGVVTAIGSDVSGFAIGDRVMAFAPASLSTHTITASHAVMRMPDGMDFASAATVPVAFLTVAYAVGHLARLSHGETILIHGAAGGVGLAAVQYAQLRGARIIATAGSSAKRALLNSLGVEAVLDSRSLAFADEVMTLTGGEGVDVVLNSLAGEAMRRSLALVKPFGRFLELGKRDFYENSTIGLRPFRHNVTYFGIDADQLPLRRPALAAELFAEISTLMASGQLRALPHRVYDYAESEAAFRLMQSAGHIGKIVLAPSETLPAAMAEAATLDLSGEGTFLVTGGLSGFGLEAARWLGRQGARQIALFGRRGIGTPGAAEAIAQFSANGIEARAYEADVADEQALSEALAIVRDEQGPIRGVIHAAVAMDDALLGALDSERFARALATKLGGAEALDRLTRQDPIELFLLFSSVTTPMGNPGQGNYVAANAAVEAVAERRHAAGLPALAIQWGPIGDAGYLTRASGVGELLSRQIGAAHLTAAQALEQIPALLAAKIPVAGFATVRWAGLRKSLPLLGSSLFADMDLGVQSETSDVDLRAMLANCSPEEARQTAIAMLIEEVARIMKLTPDRIEPQRPLTELGMDSLMAVELRLAVEQRFGVSVPVLALSEGATLATMAGRILRSLPKGNETHDQVDEKAALVERLARHESGFRPANDTPAETPRAAAAALP